MSYQNRLYRMTEPFEGYDQNYPENAYYNDDSHQDDDQFASDSDPLPAESTGRDFLVTATIQLLVNEQHESWAMMSVKDTLQEVIDNSTYPNDGLNGIVIDDIYELDGGDDE